MDELHRYTQSDWLLVVAACMYPQREGLVMRWIARPEHWWNRDPYRAGGQLPYADPLRAGRHPFQTFLLVLCVISGAPQMFGYTTAGSIEDSLPEWLVISWGVFLFFGPATSLIGADFWRKDYATALTLERIGLYLTGAAAIIYAVCIVKIRGYPSLVAGGITLAFGLACLRRAADIAVIFYRALQGDGAPDVETEEGR